MLPQPEQSEAFLDIAAKTPALVEEYLAAVSDCSSPYRRLPLDYSKYTHLPFLPDLLAARSQAHLPARPLPHHTLGTPLEHATSSQTVNNWRWLTDEERSITQSGTRLLLQQGRQYMIVDLYSDPVPKGSLTRIGRRQYLPFTEHSRVSRLLSHLQQSGARVKGWIPFENRQ